MLEIYYQFCINTENLYNLKQQNNLKPIFPQIYDTDDM